MGQIKWTNEQEQAIKETKRNLLVAAAAGSGKTAVLVERMIQKIVKEKIDIDSLLVVTFTNAAASEMREKILNAIYQKLEEEPENMHLQRQLNLLSKARICTIHAFCLDVIRNHFYECDLPANFRIANSSEIELLKQEVLEQLFEEKYLNQDNNFLKLLQIYTSYKADEPLKEMVLTIYRLIQSCPFPFEWLEEKIEQFHFEDKQIDFAHTVWGKILIKEYEKHIIEAKLGLKKVNEMLDTNPELTKFSEAIRKDREGLEGLKNNLDCWDKTYKLASSFSFTKWPVDRKITSSIKEEAKQIRDSIQKKFKAEKEKILVSSSEEALQDMEEMYLVIQPLYELIFQFDTQFAKAKKERNILDFNDIEHFALRILIKKEQQGKIGPSSVAKEYQKKFKEIAIDEYQDSNLVQELILTTISRGNNLFMVGDVKQSIYRFRQAKPELFLEKYRTYQKKEQAKEEEPIKIQLFKNFRSRQTILEITNRIFQEIMSLELGQINYTKEEYLNLGANYPNPEEKFCFGGKAQLHIIDLKQEEENQEEKEEPEEQLERIEDTLLEARFVANKIKQLINSHYFVYDSKKGYRPLQYRDMVILLRATSTCAPIYEKELVEQQIPVYSDSSSNYLDSVEIQTMMAVLKILDNPMQEIPFVTVLRSMIGGFTDEELLEIRLVDTYSNFYECFLKAKLQVSPTLQQKIESFLEKLEKWRKKQEYLPLDELIWQIYQDTGYDHYVELMPNGAMRKANLRMLFERAKQYESTNLKGLFQFIRFIDQLKLSSGDLGAAKIIGETEDVVRIMSIHKSKGLEFPVVFLCGTGKKFNLQDLSQVILFDQELGLGPKYINHEKKIQYDTLAKEAVKRKLRTETISEEMRILYVALTRAKEKLIITGMAKDLQKDLADKEEKLKQYFVKDNKLDNMLVEKGRSYLDWLELVYLQEKETISDWLELHTYTKKELFDSSKEKQEVTQEETIHQIYQQLEKHQMNDKQKQKIQKTLEWQYPNSLSTQIPGKISVTEIKEQEKKQQMKKQEQNDAKEEQNDEKEETKLEKQIPNFMQEKQITNAQKGTILHLCMQRLDPKKDYTIELLKEDIEKMIANQFITQQEANTIKVEKIYDYLKSDLWKRIKEAKKVEKEKPFYLLIKASRLYGPEAKEDILVQGIIDLYFIDKDDKLVIVDYKTDYLQDRKEEELKQKYVAQLEIYQEALEEDMRRKVDEIYLYSTFLGKEVRIK